MVRSFPSRNSALSFWVSPGSGAPAPGGPPRTPGSLWAKQDDAKASVTIATRHDSRELNFIGFLQTSNAAPDRRHWDKRICAANADICSATARFVQPFLGVRSVNSQYRLGA